MTALPIPVEDFRLAGCAGKDSLTRAQAKEVSARMNWSRRGRLPTNPYRCDHCGGWHVGVRR
jgi:hypothetical protein